MEVKLIVASGKDTGDEVTVTGSRFFIGRAEDCQLRPRSELVSRQHCVIIVEEGFVAVRDFGSKNGTLVNDEMVKGERELKSGDRLKVGDLELEVQLRASIGGTDRPKIRGVQEAAAQTVPASIDDDLDLDKWLRETDTQTLDPASLASADMEPTTDEGPLPPERQQNWQEKQKAAEVVGVWKRGHWKPTSANPRDAAADTLKDFFKKGV